MIKRLSIALICLYRTKSITQQRTTHQHRHRTNCRMRTVLSSIRLQFGFHQAPKFLLPSQEGDRNLHQFHLSLSCVSKQSERDKSLVAMYSSCDVCFNIEIYAIRSRMLQVFLSRIINVSLCRDTNTNLSSAFGNQSLVYLSTPYTARIFELKKKKE